MNFQLIVVDVAEDDRRVDERFLYALDPGVGNAKTFKPVCPCLEPFAPIHLERDVIEAGPDFVHLLTLIGRVVVQAHPDVRVRLGDQVRIPGPHTPVVRKLTVHQRGLEDLLIPGDAGIEVPYREDDVVQPGDRRCRYLGCGLGHHLSRAKGRRSIA